MQMTFRWFGPAYDPIQLEQIRQIPGITGVITTLYDKMHGEVWRREEVAALRLYVEENGLKISGVESINVHDAIKAGLPERDMYIENYILSLEAVGQEGVDLVCYNFMPVFDWTRSNLAAVRPDGSTVLSYDQREINKIDPLEIFSSMQAGANGFMLPGWEPERLARISELFAIYKNVTEEKLFQNLVYFLEAIMPVCERYGIHMAIHPDDPAWPVFGLPRIITNQENLQRLLSEVDNQLNGVTLCTGSLGSDPNNDIPTIIRTLGSRIHFAHVRNLVYMSSDRFDEAAHLSSDGSLDMYAVMKALYDVGFSGPVRPDHGRAIWGEVAMPGYGLYDRALGATYLNGLWEAIDKNLK